MSLTELLEIAIALVFLYLLFSQVTLSIVELYAGVFNTRGKFLYKRLEETLGKDSTQGLYQSAPIRALFRDGNGNTGENHQSDGVIKRKDDTPTYISAAVFTQAVLALAAPNPMPDNAAPLLNDGPAELKVFVTSDALPATSGLGRLLKAQLQDAALTAMPGAEVQKLTQNIASWYNDFQERLTGRYKRRLRLPLLLVGFLVAVICNVDTLQIVSYLRTHPADRQQAVNLATQFVRNHSNGVPEMKPATGKVDEQAATASRQQIVARYVDSLATSLQRQGMPIGWWRVVVPDTTTTAEDSQPAVKQFSIVKPSTAVVQLPGTHQVFLTNKARQAFDSLKMVLKKEADKLGNDFAEVESAYKGAELAQNAPIDAAKFAAAETRTRQAINNMMYVAQHFKEATGANDGDSNRVISKAKALGAKYDKLLQQLQNARPVRRIYPAYYVRYTWVPGKPETACAGTSLKPGTWLRMCSSQKDAAFPLFNGQPQLTQTAFNGRWSVIGWLLTGLAMMVGAPFWFDLLSRFVNIRNVGIKPT